MVSTRDRTPVCTLDYMFFTYPEYEAFANDNLRYGHVEHIDAARFKLTVFVDSFYELSPFDKDMIMLELIDMME